MVTLHSKYTFRLKFLGNSTKYVKKGDSEVTIEVCRVPVHNGGHRPTEWGTGLVLIPGVCKGSCDPSDSTPEGPK